MESLKKPKDFRVVYNRGKSVANRYFVLFAYRNKSGGCRLGVSVSKKVGKAIVRNKARRRMKECVRQHGIAVQGYDFILIARLPVATANYAALESALLKLFQKMASSLPVSS